MFPLRRRYRLAPPAPPVIPAEVIESRRLRRETPTIVTAGCRRVATAAEVATDGRQRRRVRKAIAAVEATTAPYHRVPATDAFCAAAEEITITIIIEVVIATTGIAEMLRD